jgi:PKD repeat protein
VSTTNFFLTPSNFKDQDNNTPPAIWDGSKYHVFYAGAGNEVTLNSIVASTAGQTFGMSVTSVYNGSSLVVSVGDTEIFNNSLSAGDTVHIVADDFPVGSQVMIQITPPSEGSYYCDVTLTPDADEGEEPGDETVAAFTASGTSLAVTVTDSSVAKAGATITAWSWNFGDGTALVTTQSASHTYVAPGAYSITLTVTDSTGGTATQLHNVIVSTPVVPGADTYSVKGFVAYGSMSNNDPETVATLGELSVRSETFAKDRSLFSTTAGTGQSSSSVNLSVFSSKKADGSVVPVPADYSTQLLTMAAWIYTQSIAGQFSANASACQQQIVAEFSSSIKDVTVGTMLQQGSQWMPEYVVFHFNAASNSSGAAGYTTQSRIKLWFADHSFATEYDEYLIDFVTPLPPGSALDDFFKPSAQVVAEVAQMTLPKIMQQIQVVAGNDPYTLVKTIEFDYHDFNDTTFTSPTNWTFVIYGAGGDNVDAIKAALIDYILSNSSHSRDDWSKIFPDIFTATEFVICPLWNQYAVPNKDLVMGVYSPTANLVNVQTIAPSVFIGTRYTSSHITANTEVTGVPYKSLALAICGGPENRNGIARFSQKFVDYMAVPTSSLDFNRMSPDTQAWVSLLYQLLLIAEEMTEFSDIPIGFTRLKRTNANGESVLYVVASVDNVQYLVVAKDYLMTAFPPPAALSLVTPVASSISAPNNGGATTQTFAAGGGQGPYIYQLASIDSRIVNGAINPSTGAFTCTLPSWGNYSVSIKVTDALGATYTGNYTLVSLSVPS